MNDDAILDRLRSEMQRRYDVVPDAVRIVESPYRICPLGAHIDHQLGPVTAMAIDRAVHLAFAPSGSREIRLSSLSFDGEINFGLDGIPPRREDDWGNYVRGAALALEDHVGLEQGILGVTAGRLGAGGLSSSAAIGVAYLLALEDVNGLALSETENIRLDQAIENGSLGLRNGILDQAAILLSREDHLTLIDCRDANHRLIPRAESMPPFDILIAFSGLEQALVTTGYNQRVDECAEAAKTLLDLAGRPGEPHLLGNVTPDEYGAYRSRLTGDPARRAAHFFGETERVRAGVEAWGRGDLVGFGRLMTESGRSSIDNYECGSPPLIDLYEILVETEGVYGARFSGAGFRGCCVAVVDAGAGDEAAQHVRDVYGDRYPDLAADAPVFLCGSCDGARIL
ncbi:MAG: galactokinase family protein [Candidatus Latescibacteria bacterium]|nr:galactokinase family protein [Candidatus Latescibacterota bacterium]